MTEKQGKPRSWCKEEVGPRTTMADIISRWTGIPVTRLLEGEREKLLRLERPACIERVIGQDAAVQRGGRRRAAGPGRA